MGNIVWIRDAWFLNGTDKLLTGEIVEIEQPNGDWIRVTIDESYGAVYHPAPSGPPFNNNMTIRRVS